MLTDIEYDVLCNTHKNNVQRLDNIKKKYNKIKKKCDSLKHVMESILNINIRNGLLIKIHNGKDITLHNRNKIDYTIKCIQWCKSEKITLSFISMTNDEIINKCHRLLHSKLLHSFTFVLKKECTKNGCMSWTYGDKSCCCGRKTISYDEENIDYRFNGDISIDDIHPVYKFT